MSESAVVRPLQPSDAPAVDHICRESPWVVAYFAPSELARLLATRPGVGVFDGRGGLRAFLLSTSLVAPVGWLGGFGVPWHERAAALDRLDDALPAWLAAMRAGGAATVYYSGNDAEHDWLRDPLEQRGFRDAGRLHSYDKIGTHSPTTGNRAVTVRPFDSADLAGVLAVEDAAFAPPWRHDAREFLETADDYPCFIVAVDAQGLAGYLFASVEEELGYLVRIAVHPARQGQGIGSRLLAEVMRFFAAEGVARVLLNTQEDNAAAQRLYVAWGFELIAPQGFVLARDLPAG